MSHITITWHNDQFNVSLHSKEGADEFLTIKGCRIAHGSKGDFVSYPSRKTDRGYWNHVWGSDKFNAAVLEKAKATQPQGGGSRRSRDAADDDGSVPF